MEGKNMESVTGFTAPRLISGFPEWLPQEKILENRILDIVRKHFELSGFAPIETPAVERREVLIAKGGNEKEIYTLGRLSGDIENDDSKELALHFDLTVPLARYVAQYHRELTFPFRRYQIQKVWRGERPQAGRFREFYQCDIDVIGDGELSLLTDAEIPSIIFRIFQEMNIGPFIIRVNNRKILQGFFASIGVPEGKNAGVMRVVDKLDKVGINQVSTELISVFGLSTNQAAQVIDFTSLKLESTMAVESLTKKTGMGELYQQGVAELSVVLKGMMALGLPTESFQVDLSIARGLDYYTGTVYETSLVNHPGIGSVCSGGRYENLASHFTDRKLPGVGISIGITRLLSRLIKAGIVKSGASTIAPVLVTSMDVSRMLDYLGIAASLRAAGVNTEIYLESKKIGAQLKFANRKGFLIAIIAGERELSAGCATLKNLQTGEQSEVALSELTARVKELL